jgi:hypothetical protein
MSTDYILFTLQQIRISLAEATYDAGLTHEPETVPQSVARRLKAHMKELAIILRRLIMLMALSLCLEAVKPRPPAKPRQDDEPVMTKAQVPFSIALSGQTQVYSLDGPGFPEGGARVSGPVPAASLMRRFEALARILRNPEKYAVRLARVMERRRRAGAPRPICQAMPTHRLKPELGAIAAALPMLLADAFDQWNNSS